MFNPSIFKLAAKHLMMTSNPTYLIGALKFESKLHVDLKEMKSAIQKAEVKGHTVQNPYIRTTVTVFEYNTSTRENKNQGQFTFQLQPVKGATTLTIFRSGCARALMSFNLSRQINWTLQNKVYVYFKDPRNVQWLLQFTDPVSAAQATALISILLSVTSIKDIAYYEAQNLTQSRPIQIGDSVKISYWVFTFSSFPYIQGCYASKEEFNTVIQRDKLPTGWVSGLIGMMCGNTRTVYVPAQYTMLENGQRDTSIPSANVIIVATLHRAKFKDGSDTCAPTVSEVETKDAIPEPIETAQPVGENASVTEDQPVPLTEEEEEEDDSELTEEAPAQEPEPEPVGDERQLKIDRLRKMGAVAGAFAMPVIPPRRGAEAPTAKTSSLLDDVSSPKVAMSMHPSKKPAYLKDANFNAGLSAMLAAPSQPQRANAIAEPISDPSKSTLENRVDNMEQSINTKLDVLCGGTEAGAVISGIASLAAYIDIKQREIDILKKQIEEEKQISMQVSVASIDAVKREAERVKRSNAQLEKSLREAETKRIEMEATLQEAGEAAKGREKTLVKRLMEKVFSDVNDVFDEKKLYSGSQVSQQLYDMLRKQSFSILEDIDTNGLF